MNQIFLLLLVTIAIVIISSLILAFVLWGAKNTLFKGQIAWKAKEIPIRRNKSSSKSSLLKRIDLESSNFLKNQKEEARNK